MDISTTKLCPKRAKVQTSPDGKDVDVDPSSSQQDEVVSNFFVMFALILSRNDNEQK